jgi:Uma2 family endonuclease
MTVAEYRRIREDERFRDELSRGRLIREPRPGGEHGVVTANLFAALHAHVAAHGLGRVLIETGYLLAHEPPTVRGPDVSFIAAGRLPDVPPTGFWRLAPDLVAEVVSPGDRAEEMRRRVADYLAAGTREVWLVRIRSRAVIRHRTGERARVFGDAADLTTPLLPGLRIPVASLFAL